jgi:pimeloyl-ACP methyl ester carboxylesterase
MPVGEGSDMGIALFPGTGAEFYQPWLRWLGPRLAAAGYRVISLNRRDHGGLFGYFKLAESAMDHKTAIDWLAARGARRIVMAGHSYGTLTTLCYVRATNDARVTALVLYAPVGDMRAATVPMVGGQEEYDRLVTEARRKVRDGKGMEAFLIGPTVPQEKPIAHSYEVFLDKRGPDSAAVGWELIGAAGDRPLLAVRDPDDPFVSTHPPTQRRLEAANPKLKYVLLAPLPRPAVDDTVHRFAGREEEVLALTLRWLEHFPPK